MVKFVTDSIIHISAILFLIPELVDSLSIKMMSCERAQINMTSFFARNWKMNCIPESIVNMTIDDYEEFLEERRYLMAQKIKKYFAVL